MDKAFKKAIAAIDTKAWTGIKYPQAIYDETTGTWTSKAGGAEVPYTAFTSRKKAERIPGRLVVRRIPELNPKHGDGQPTLFDTHRFHAFFSTTDPEVLDTVAANATHQQHAIIEKVNADLNDSALAYLPSGHFWANSAWLPCVVMAYNLTRTAGVIAAGAFARARTGTIRAKLVSVPVRAASSARRIRLRLPESWPWQHAFERLFTVIHPPPKTA